MLLNGPVSLLETSVLPCPATGVGAGPSGVNARNSLSPDMGFPPRVIPPKLSAITGISKAPPPTSAKLEANMLGKEASCPALNNALSEKPAVKEVPTATYLVKSAVPAVYSTGSGPGGLVGVVSSSHAIKNKPKKGSKA